MHSMKSMCLVNPKEVHSDLLSSALFTTHKRNQAITPDMMRENILTAGQFISLLLVQYADTLASSPVMSCQLLGNGVFYTSSFLQLCSVEHMNSRYGWNIPKLDLKMMLKDTNMCRLMHDCCKFHENIDMIVTLSYSYSTYFNSFGAWSRLLLAYRH